jgi:hypothetical protein
MTTIEDILAKAEDPAYHRVVTARIPLVAQALRDEHAELDALLPTLTSDTIDAHPKREATAQRLVEIEEEIADSTIEFRFQAIGHRAWADLLRAHPPTKAQREADKLIDYNPEMFPYEAIAASCADPKMTVEDVRRFEASPSTDVQAWMELWSSCISANVVATAPKSLAASILFSSGAFVKLPTITKPPGRSSSAV